MRIMDIKSIDDVEIKNSTVLVRVDYNVTLGKDKKIIDDLRIRQTLPTLKVLLKHKNKLILCSHLGDPKDHDRTLTLLPVANYLSKLINHPVILVNDWNNKKSRPLFDRQNSAIILLDNLRFWPGEMANDEDFARSLAELADIFVQDAFGVCHRPHASVIGIPKLLPSYAGLLLKSEIETISNILEHPKKPTISILGGAKISTKIKMLYKLIDRSQVLLLGGGMANTFLHAQGHEVGNSLFEKQEGEEARLILNHAKNKQVDLILPIDVIVKTKQNRIMTKLLSEVKKEMIIGDIGPATRELFASRISRGKTIIWNGPMGMVEKSVFQAGNNAVYSAIVGDRQAFSLVGGGDTIASIASKKNVDRISHLSTGGGAMIEFIEGGTLPGIEAIKG